MASLHIDHGNCLEIRMNVPEMECWACGADATYSNCGIPVYEGVVLPNDWEGEWGGVPACLACFAEQGRLKKPMEKSDFLRMMSQAFTR